MPVTLIAKVSHAALDVVHVDTSVAPPEAVCAVDRAMGALALILSVLVLGTDGTALGAEDECASRSMLMLPD